MHKPLHLQHEYGQHGPPHGKYTPTCWQSYPYICRRAHKPLTIYSITRHGGVASVTQDHPSGVDIYYIPSRSENIFARGGSTIVATSIYGNESRSRAVFTATFPTRSGKVSAGKRVATAAAASPPGTEALVTEGRVAIAAAE